MKQLKLKAIIYQIIINLTYSLITITINLSYFSNYIPNFLNFLFVFVVLSTHIPFFLPYSLLVHFHICQTEVFPVLTFVTRDKRLRAREGSYFCPFFPNTHFTLGFYFVLNNVFIKTRLLTCAGYMLFKV